MAGFPKVQAPDARRVAREQESRHAVRQVDRAAHTYGNAEEAGEGRHDETRSASGEIPGKRGMEYRGQERRGSYHAKAAAGWLLWS